MLGNASGLYCSDLAHVSLLPREYALTLEEVVGVILSLFIIVVIVALFVVCHKFRTKKRHQNRNGGRNLLIQNEFDKEHIMLSQTRNGSAGGHKLNNHEVGGREADCPLLPVQSGHRSPVITETQFNYTDTLRNYGAAAEELEPLPRLPHDFIQNIQKPVATVAPNMISDRDMNLKDNYFTRKMSPGPDGKYQRPNPPAGLRVALPPDAGEETCQSELSMEEDCQRYHWDCSDWAAQPALPALMDLPTGQIVDSASWESPNPSKTAATPAGPPLDCGPDIETLPEDGTGAGAEEADAKSDSSECESQLGAVYPLGSPMHQTNKSIEELMMGNEMNYADDDNGSVEIPNIYDYQLHLNNYLPTYHLGSDPDTDEATPMMGRHPRPFPVGAASPDPAPIYATVGPAGPQDPDSGARKASGPLRGLILPPRLPGQQQQDQLCQLEDEEEGDDERPIKRTPSPRVTRV